MITCLVTASSNWCSRCQGNEACKDERSRQQISTMDQSQENEQAPTKPVLGRQSRTGSYMRYDSWTKMGKCMLDRQQDLDLRRWDRPLDLGMLHAHIPIGSRGGGTVLDACYLSAFYSMRVSICHLPPSSYPPFVSSPPPSPPCGYC